MIEQQMPINQMLPVSFFQERHLMYHRLSPEDFQEHVRYVFHIRGQLDLSALERSLAEIQRRHSIFRTIYPESSDYYQVILPTTSSCLSFKDLRQASSAVDWQQQAKDTYKKPFDLSQDVSIRCEVLQLAEQEYILSLIIHHIAYDFHSENILFRELETCYAAFLKGSDIQLPLPKSQYKDFAVWQRQHKNSEAWLRQAEWWLQTLPINPPVLKLPPDIPTPISKGVADRYVEQYLPPELANRLTSFSKKNQVSLFVLLFSALNALIHEITGETDIVIGVLVSSRNSVNLERTIGMFIHNLIFRTNLSGNPKFTQLLQQTANNVRSVLAHRDFPLFLLSELEPSREFSRKNLNTITFNMLNSFQDSLQLPELLIKQIPSIPIHSPDLAVLVVNNGKKGIHIYWNYDAGQYSKACIENWTTQYQSLLEKMLNQPDVQLNN
jgi:hypothetical protein